jgi:Tol biopolymer transport system component
VAIVDGVQTRGFGITDLALAPDGTMMYTAGDAAGLLEMVWVTREGVTSPVDPGWPASTFGDPALSPDGRQLAVTVVQDDDYQIWVKQLPSGRFARFTTEGSNDYATWAANGRTLAFVSDRGESPDLYRRPSDGSAPAELLVDAESSIGVTTFSADGGWVVYNAAPGDIYAVPLDPLGSAIGEVSGLRTTEANERRPALSPDGRWLAYESDESGTFSAYVCPFPSCQVTYPVSVADGSTPTWSRDGSELFYVDPTGPVLMAVEVLPGTPAGWGAARTLFALDGFSLVSPRPYDVAPDGERFVMMRSEGADEGLELILVRGFSEVLRERVPN